MYVCTCCRSGRYDRLELKCGVRPAFMLTPFSTAPVTSTSHILSNPCSEEREKKTDPVPSQNNTVNKHPGFLPNLPHLSLSAGTPVAILGPSPPSDLTPPTPPTVSSTAGGPRWRSRVVCTTTMYYPHEAYLLSSHGHPSCPRCLANDDKVPSF